MVDVHSHILWALDDGAKTLEDSLAMAEQAIADGISHVVGTPHFSSQYPFDFSKVHATRQALAEKLHGRLELATGCDFHLNPENLLAIRKESAPYCINQKDFLLVEFNEYSIPPTMDQTLHELQLAGLRPIITHPERNAILRSQPERLLNWVRLGCFTQITAGSLAGVFGPGAKADAWNWMARGLVHFVASDAHDTARRPLKLKFAYDSIAEQLGEETARALLVENPLAAFNGDPLPYVPEIAEPEERRKRKRFLFF
jgi:protein-tyrosine phosphatase